MPYKVEHHGDQWEVKNEDTGDVKGTHETKEEAERQMRLLNAIENDPEWEPRNG